MANINASPHTETATFTRLQGQWLLLGRIVWGTCACIVIIAFIMTIPIRFEALSTTCNENCVSIQISDVGLSNLESALGITLFSYAVIIIFKEILAGIIYIFAAAVLFWRRPDDWMVIFISVSLLFFSQVAIVNVNLPYAQVLSGIGFGLIIILVFIFPDGRFYPRWAFGLAVVFTFPVLAIQFTPYFQTTASYLLWFLGGAAGFASQVYRYRKISTPIQRQQSKWIVMGFAMMLFGGFCLLIPVVLFPELTPPVEPTVTVADFIYRAIYAPIFIFIPMMLLPITIVFSTLRYRLWDTDPIINRGLVYAFMTVLAVALLFAITFFIQFVFGTQQPFIAILIAGAICGLTFKPAQKRIQHWVDRNLYGFRFDLIEVQKAQKSIEIKNPGALTGQIVDGYEILGVIGKGGMGEVYKGSGNDTVVAIKTMLPEIAKDEIMRTRFQREAETGKQLQHRNIAQVITNGMLNDTPYIVMEYIEGNELGQLLKDKGTIDIETSISIVRDICNALEIAHQQGLVHRDIKPGNTIIRKNGEAVLMDFGISKIQDTTSALTGTGAIGTIDYMAPEQIASAREVDHRADIYALGVMLFQMITGEKPFSGGAAQVIFAHLQQPPPWAFEINPEISYELAETIQRAMAKDPDERYQSANEFGEALLLSV